MQSLIPICANKRKSLAIVDTGATVSFISSKFAKKCHIRILQNSMCQPLFTADEKRLNVFGLTNVNIILEDYKTSYDFYVVEKLNHSLLFGIDLLKMTGCKIDLKHNCVFFNNDLIVWQLQKLDRSMSLLKSSDRVHLPPYTEALKSVRLTNRAAKQFDGYTAIIELFVSATQRGIFVANAFVERPKTDKLICRIFNYWEKTFR